MIRSGKLLPISSHPNLLGEPPATLLPPTPDATKMLSEGKPAVEVAAAFPTFSLAWALLAEPVDQLVDAERLAYRERYAALIADELRAAIDAGEIPGQDVAFTAAVLVGGCGEALVGPLSSVEGSDQLLASIQTFVRRAIGAV